MLLLDLRASGILYFVLVAVAFYFGVSAVIAWAIGRATHAPITSTPASLGLAYEDVTSPSRGDKVRLQGWYIPGGSRGTVIAIHGGQRNRMDTAINMLGLCGDLARSGFNVLTFDRRACGQSEVPPLKLRPYLDRDVAGAVDYVQGQNGPGEKVFALGTSLGALAALVFAVQEKAFCAIVSDSCFARTPEIIGRVLARINIALPVFVPGALLMARAIYGLRPPNAINCIRVDCPVFFINGADDRGVPPADARRLYRASGNNMNELWIVPGTGHCQAYRTHPKEYVGRVTQFFTEKCAPT